MYTSSKVECQVNLNNYHPCERTFSYNPYLKKRIVQCITNKDYISPYTKGIFKCATIQRTQIVNPKVSFKYGIKCEMRYTAVVDQKDSTISDKDVYLGSPCQKPLVKWIPALNTTTSECKSESFPDIKYQHLFKCQTIWRPTKLSNGTIINIGVGCEARFKHDCRNNHPNCSKPVSDPAMMTKKVVFRRNKKQYQRKQLIQG